MVTENQNLWEPVVGLSPLDQEKKRYKKIDLEDVPNSVVWFKADLKPGPRDPRDKPTDIHTLY